MSADVTLPAEVVQRVLEAFDACIALPAIPDPFVLGLAQGKAMGMRCRLELFVKDAQLEEETAHG